MVGDIWLVIGDSIWGWWVGVGGAGEQGPGWGDVCGLIEESEMVFEVKFDVLMIAEVVDGVMDKKVDEKTDGEVEVMMEVAMEVLDGEVMGTRMWK